MTAQVPLPPAGRRRALHLLWALPVGIAGALALIGVASFNWCGIAACRTHDRGSGTVSLVFVILAGAAVAAPLFLVPWTRRGTRAVTAVVAGIAAAIAGGLIVFTM